MEVSTTRREGAKTVTQRWGWCCWSCADGHVPSPVPFVVVTAKAGRKWQRPDVREQKEKKNVSSKRQTKGNESSILDGNPHRTPRFPSLVDFQRGGGETVTLGLSFLNYYPRSIDVILVLSFLYGKDSIDRCQLRYYYYYSNRTEAKHSSAG